MNFLTKAELYERVEAIRRNFSDADPFDPFSAAEKLHIKVEYYLMESSRFGGALFRDGERALIVINSSKSKESRRFIACHELIHYFLHKSENSFCCDENSPSVMEWQANEGAAELLIPYKKFLLFYGNIRSLYMTDPERAVQRLANEFSVSTAMIRNRFESLSPEIAQLEEGRAISEIEVISKTKAAPKRCSTVDVFADE